MFALALIFFSLVPGNGMKPRPVERDARYWIKGSFLAPLQDSGKWELKGDKKCKKCECVDVLPRELTKYASALRRSEGKTLLPLGCAIKNKVGTKDKIDSPQERWFMFEPGLSKVDHIIHYYEESSNFLGFGTKKLEWRGKVRLKHTGTIAKNIKTKEMYEGKMCEYIYPTLELNCVHIAKQKNGMTLVFRCQEDRDMFARRIEQCVMPEQTGRSDKNLLEFEFPESDDSYETMNHDAAIPKTTQEPEEKQEEPEPTQEEIRDAMKYLGYHQQREYFTDVERNIFNRDKVMPVIREQRRNNAKYQRFLEQQEREQQKLVLEQQQRELEKQAAQEAEEKRAEEQKRDRINLNDMYQKFKDAHPIIITEETRNTLTRVEIRLNGSWGVYQPGQQQLSIQQVKELILKRSDGKGQEDPYEILNEQGVLVCTFRLSGIDVLSKDTIVQKIKAKFPNSSLHTYGGMVRGIHVLRPCTPIPEQLVTEIYKKRMEIRKLKWKVGGGVSKGHFCCRDFSQVFIAAVKEEQLFFKLPDQYAIGEVYTRCNPDADGNEQAHMLNIILTCDPDRNVNVRLFEPNGGVFLSDADCAANGYDTGVQFVVF